MTEAETLRAAAVKLRLVGGSATPGPWRVVEDEMYASHQIGARREEIEDGVYYCEFAGVTAQGRAEADWIAALSPAIAEPLAAWLEDEALTFEEYPYSDDSPNPLGPAVARAILGGDS